MSFVRRITNLFKSKSPALIAAPKSSKPLRAEDFRLSHRVEQFSRFIPRLDMDQRRRLLGTLFGFDPDAKRIAYPTDRPMYVHRGHRHRSKHRGRANYRHPDPRRRWTLVIGPLRQREAAMSPAVKVKKEKA